MIYNILIAGAARSGKNTVGNILHKYFPELTLIGFADELKKIACNITGISLNNLENYKNNNKTVPGWNITARSFLQELATLIKKTDDNYFINKITKSSIITDARFYNEVTVLRNRSKVFVLGVIDPDLNSNDKHISETELVSSIQQLYNDQLMTQYNYELFSYSNYFIDYLLINKKQGEALLEKQIKEIIPLIKEKLP